MSYSYSFLVSNGTDKAENRSSRSVIFTYPGFNAEMSAQYSVSFKPGVYFIECWGASGNLGRGAYTNGSITFLETTKLYFFIGESVGKFNCVPPSAIAFSGYFGGGATDVRLVNSPYYELESLKSRIMVAAGGASKEFHPGSGGNGGSLEGEIGITGLDFPALGATQTQGGRILNDINGIGSFGFAGYLTRKVDFGGTGGGGYYGGASVITAGTGSGGSSFISGYVGCDAIDINGNHTGQPIHYSKYVFSNTSMSPGSCVIPNGRGGFETGHLSNGMVKITAIKLINVSCFQKLTQHKPLFCWSLTMIVFLCYYSG